MLKHLKVIEHWVLFFSRGFRDILETQYDSRDNLGDDFTRVGDGAPGVTGPWRGYRNGPFLCKMTIKNIISKFCPGIFDFPS